MADDKTDAEQRATRRSGRVALQGWYSVILWMSIGLLLETLMAYKSPGYLGDPQRRELFRLGHAHGTILGLVLVVAALWIRRVGAKTSPLSLSALRIGAAIMPVGFFLAGIWHPEGDPGLAIWLVPVGAVSLIFGLISIALTRGVEG